MELRRARLPLAILVAALAVDLSTACSSGGGGGGGGVKPQLSDIQTKIFTPSCALPACHDVNATATQNNLKLTDASTSFAALVGVAAFDTTAGTMAGCPNRVTASDPTHSFLVYKLDPANFPGGVSPIHGLGVLMPNGTAGLSAADRNAISQWITNGAQNN